MNDDTVRVLEDEVLRARVRRVTPLTGSIQNKAYLLHCDPERFVLTESTRGNGPDVEVALLQRVAGRLPVPQPVHHDTGRMIGRPFVVKRFVPGRTLDTVLPHVTGTEAAELGRAVGMALAAVGAVGFDRPGQFTGPALGTRPHREVDLSALPEHVADRLAPAVTAHHLSALDRDRLLAVVTREAEALARFRDQSRLVHSDFNGKNIVVRRDGGRWRLGAVLDWEFAYSGPPLADIGNHLRFPEDLPPAYRSGFLAGFTAGGGVLDEDWQRCCRLLDLYALADFAAAGPRHPLFTRTLRRFADIVAAGSVRAR